jgi:hypothetical protein
MSGVFDFYRVTPDIMRIDYTASLEGARAMLRSLTERGLVKDGSPPWEDMSDDQRLVLLTAAEEFDRGRLAAVRTLREELAAYEAEVIASGSCTTCYEQRGSACRDMRYYKTPETRATRHPHRTRMEAYASRPRD